MFGMKKDAETLSKIMEDCIGQDYKKVELDIHPVKVNVFDVYAKRAFIRERMQEITAPSIFAFADVPGPIKAAYCLIPESEGTFTLLRKDSVKEGLSMDKAMDDFLGELNDIAMELDFGR